MPRFKQVDFLTFRALLGPFIVSFLIAIFVLVMQVLYLWIDELADKGVGILVLLEMIFYMSFVFVPKALLVSILLATVMVYGSLAETYQLASFKAGGISLWRVMRSSVLFIFGLAIFSFISSNYLIPEAQVKFRKRFHEIKSKKPALVMETGIFNKDFSGYAIRIGSKSRNGKDIDDVLIYDMTEGSDKVNIIMAQQGRMQMLENQGVFLMELFDGQLYQEDRSSRRSSEFLTPFVRTKFSKLIKAFDLSDFEMKESSEDLFKNNRFNKNTQELRVEADTMLQKLANIQEASFGKFAYDHAMLYGLFEGISEDKKAGGPIPVILNSDKLKVNYDTIWDESALELFQPQSRADIAQKALSSVRSVKREVDVSITQYRRMKKERVKIIYELHNRYSEAAACLLFLFIGVPMGAIVRKGGFGFPLLIAIVFFVTFMMLSIALRKLAESFVVSPVFSAWFGFFVLAPVGFSLTYIAMNDVKPSWFSRIGAFFSSIWILLRPKKGDEKENN